LLSFRTHDSDTNRPSLQLRQRVSKSLRRVRVNFESNVKVLFSGAFADFDGNRGYNNACKQVHARKDIFDMVCDCAWNHQAEACVCHEGGESSRRYRLLVLPVFEYYHECMRNNSIQYGMRVHAVRP
jgi:hypothetical protein